MWKFGTLWWTLRKELALAWAMLRDARTPAGAKLAILAAGLYVLSPVDLVSDLLLRLATRLLPGELHAALKAQVEKRHPGAAR